MLVALLSFTTDSSFTISPIDDATFARMQKGGSFPKHCTIDRNDLRYLRILHYGYDGKVKQGELVCNKAIAQDLIEIFRELYANKYQIERMTLIDDYDADDEKSMSHNNSSSFCFRVVNGTKVLSKHAQGMAIDINTLHNPCVRYNSNGSIKKIEPDTPTARKYAKRKPRLPHMIDKSDLCYKLFKKHGFRWGGDWPKPKDYQHFER